MLRRSVGTCLLSTFSLWGLLVSGQWVWGWTGFVSVGNTENQQRVRKWRTLWSRNQPGEFFVSITLSFELLLVVSLACALFLLAVSVCSLLMALDLRFFEATAVSVFVMVGCTTREYTLPTQHVSVGVTGDTIAWAARQCVCVCVCVCVA